jgi:uncharacterized protein YwqG
MERSDAIKLIRGSSLGRHAEVLIEHLAPSTRVIVGDEVGVSDEESTRSWFGGLPSLPKGANWPYWDNRELAKAKIEQLEEKFRQDPRTTGLRDIAAQMRADLPTRPTPLSFLAQLDLSELADSTLLDGWPESGKLLFFYGGGWGFDPQEKGNCCVVYFPTGISLAELNEPQELSDNLTFPKRSVRFQREWTLPCNPRKDWPKDDYRILRQNLLATNETAIHRSGGWPEEVQGEMRLECQLVTNGIYCGDSSGYGDPRVKTLALGAKDWKLLLQLDSDDKAGWMWGDAGRVYFWAKQQDILARDFGSAWAIQQCY